MKIRNGVGINENKKPKKGEQLILVKLGCIKCCLIELIHKI